MIALVGLIDYSAGMEVSQELAERVLQWVGSPNYRPSKAKQIAAALGIDLDSELRELKRVVKWLVAKRRLRYGPNHLILGLEESDPASRAEPATSSSSKTQHKTATAAPVNRTAKHISSDRSASAEHSESSAGGSRQHASQTSDVSDEASSANEVTNRGANAGHEQSTEASMAIRRSPSVKLPSVVEGTFRRAMGGFGFVRLTQGVPGAETLDDVFIPPGRTGGALEGDTVRVRIDQRSDFADDGAEGSIEEVLKRGRRQFTGTFEFRSGQAVVHVDGLSYDQPIAVGDVRGLPLEGDEKVFVELVQFPDAMGRGGEAVILEVLGKTNNPAIDTLTIMRQYALPEGFPRSYLRMHESKRICIATKLNLKTLALQTRMNTVAISMIY